MAHVAQFQAEAASERALPHSIEAERAAHGAVMVNPKTWPVVSVVVSERDFYRDAHRRIYRAIVRLSGAGVSPDPLTLSEDLKRSGDLEECGGPAYLSALTDGVPRSVNAEHYAAIVREKSRLRAAIAVGNDIVAAAYEGARDACEIVADGTRRLAEEVAAQGARPVSAVVAAREYTRSLDEATALIPTGFSDVDDMLGGLPRRSLAVMAARPSVGKSSFALGIADRLARGGLGVAYFSPEMTRQQLSARLLSWRCGVPTAAFERGIATPEQYAALAQAQEDLASLPLDFDDEARTLVEVSAWCQRLREERGSLSCVIVDYMQLLIPDRRQASREQEVAALSRGLKRLAKDQDVAVIALSQLSRAPETRRDKRPHLSDLRESGALEQDADIALLLFRAEMHKSDDANIEGLAECIVAKNRNGPVGVVRLQFEKALAEFRDLSVQGGL